MYVCMYVCMHACMYVGMYVCMYVGMRVHALHIIRHLMTYIFGKTTRKVLLMLNVYHLSNTFVMHLHFHQRSPCPTTGKVL